MQCNAHSHAAVNESIFNVRGYTAECYVVVAEEMLNVTWPALLVSRIRCYLQSENKFSSFEFVIKHGNS